MKMHFLNAMNELYGAYWNGASPKTKEKIRDEIRRIGKLVKELGSDVIFDETKGEYVFAKEEK